MRRLALLAVATTLGAYALARYGRARVVGELSPLGTADALSVASSLSTMGAIEAGLRALTGQSAYGYQS